MDTVFFVFPILALFFVVDSNFDINADKIGGEGGIGPLYIRLKFHYLYIYIFFIQDDFYADFPRCSKFFELLKKTIFKTKMYEQIFKGIVYGHYTLLAK